MTPGTGITVMETRDDNALLLAIGPESSESWQRAAAASGGRIVALGERPDTATFYEAADIYVDSYPFSSITSMLEAGSYGLPVVTCCPYQGDSRVLGSGAPGLSDVMVRTSNPVQYRVALNRLIEEQHP